MSSILESAPVGAYLPAETRWDLPAGVLRTWTYPARTSPRVRLVAVHGFRGDHHGLDLVARALPDDVETVVPDLPGFGRSPAFPARAHDVAGYAEILGQLLEALPQDGLPLAVLGHSYGSVVAAALAAQHPDAVAALALLNPICEPALASAQRLPARGAALFYRVCAVLPEALGDRLVRSAAITRISSELMMKTRDAHLRRFINGQHAAYFGAFASRRVVIQAYADSIRATVGDWSGQVTVRTLLVAAERDDLGSVAGQRRLRETFPPQAQARLEVLPEVGHLIHYETPRRAARVVGDFLAEALPETGAAPAASSSRPAAGPARSDGNGGAA
ncbi:alpha/beta fold hydrolase [Rothia kristinae]|uniref:alpha/beta fold hydrolase n=1 Tax=Rothia kristinae TaxID=37923 RepID=UPI0013F4E796|nr:alpha/beta hydrolase [Rothia kristinae]